METSDVLDVLGSLISQLKAYAAKLPPVVHLAVAPAGFKPKPESVDLFEQALARFREQSTGSAQRAMTEYLVESLEAFEAGKLLGSVQPLLTVLDHLDRMKRDSEIKVTPADEKRMAEYRTALTKILPGSQPELKGAGRGM